MRLVALWPQYGGNDRRWTPLPSLPAKDPGAAPIGWTSQLVSLFCEGANHSAPPGTTGIHPRFKSSVSRKNSLEAEHRLYPRLFQETIALVLSFPSVIACGHAIMSGQILSHYASESSHPGLARPQNTTLMLPLRWGRPQAAENLGTIMQWGLSSP